MPDETRAARIARRLNQEGISTSPTSAIATVMDEELSRTAGYKGALDNRVEFTNTLRARIHAAVCDMETKCLDNHRGRLDVTNAVHVAVMKVLAPCESDTPVDFEIDTPVMDCPTCDGQREVRFNFCETCHNTGVVHLAVIAMILWCPACHARHVDAGEFATKPHHTHACQGCGMVWRPAVYCTVGVQHLRGFKD